MLLNKINITEITRGVTRWTVPLIATLLLSLPGHAGVIFSDIGTGNSYNFHTGYDVGHGNTEANQFTPTTTAALWLVELGVGRVSGSNQLDVVLTADHEGEPGAVIESFHFNNAMGTQGTNNPLLSMNSVVQPTLHAGTEYWLLVTTTDSKAAATWDLSSTGADGQLAQKHHDDWSESDDEMTMAAFRLSSNTPGGQGGSSVPEPGTLLLLLAGGALAGVRVVRPRLRAR